MEAWAWVFAAEHARISASQHCSQAVNHNSKCSRADQHQNIGRPFKTAQASERLAAQKTQEVLCASTG
eukprot:scaffold256242_cov18-Tisochrysis_lutea.AAC.1